MNQENTNKTENEGSFGNPSAQQTAYSAPNSAQTPPVYTNIGYTRPRKARRVGTLTMGLFMIASGIAAIYGLFHPEMDLLQLLKFAPLLLISLGIEVLINYFINREDRLKYDFLSGFICVCLLLGNLVFAAMPFAVKSFGPERSMAQQRIEEQIHRAVYEDLQANSTIRTLEVQVELFEEKLPMQMAELQPTDRVVLRMNLSDVFENKEAFAKECQTILGALKKFDLIVDDVSFSVDSDKRWYSLSLYDEFMKNMEYERLLQEVQSGVTDE